MFKQMDLSFINSGHVANMNMKLEKRANKSKEYHKRKVKESQQRLVFGYTFMYNASESEYLAQMKNRCEDTRLGETLHVIAKEQTVTTRLMNKQIHSTKLKCQRFLKSVNSFSSPRRRASAPAHLKWETTHRLPSQQENRSKSVTFPLPRVRFFQEENEVEYDRETCTNSAEDKEALVQRCPARVQFEENVSDFSSCHSLPEIDTVRMSSYAGKNCLHGKNMSMTASTLRNTYKLQTSSVRPRPLSQQRASERNTREEAELSPQELSKLSEEDRIERRLRKFLSKQIEINNGNPISDEVKDEREKVRFLSSSSRTLKPRQAWIVKEARKALGMAT